MGAKYITLTQRIATRAHDGRDLLLRNRKTGQVHQLDHRSEVVLGCSSHCDIVVDDPYTSSTHCSLQHSLAKGWMLRDCDSTNGTRINGTRVKVAELSPGNQISIGNTDFEFVERGGACGDTLSQIIGKAPLFLDALGKALRAARSNCSVLILGETGTGKELVARAIHEASRRVSQPFVAVNCGGFAKELIRSELFGHVKGSFTGATETHNGLFSQADGGTIFLDELGELPRELQPHLLRALESGLIRRVGGRLEELVNVRIVAATNRGCLNQKTSPLRADLFHRLSAVVVELPPLRHRQQDIPLLIESFLHAGVREYGERRIESHTLAMLSEHEWKGNIRELQNSVTRALALGRTQLVVSDFLPHGIVRHQPRCAEPVVAFDMSTLTMFEQNQRRLLADAYHQMGSIRAAANHIGIPKSTFADLCQRYLINTKRKKSLRCAAGQPAPFSTENGDV